ncbi:hypothetical protein LTR16_009401, partial [Cryomyces antarcticus]
MQKIIDLGRLTRERRTIGLKTPLKSLVVIHTDAVYLEDVRSLETYVCDEKMSAASEGILNCLSDLASTPGFRGEYNIGHPFLSDLVHVLLSVELIAPGRWHLLQPTGACLVLGNLAQTDEICIRMVEELQIHKPLVHILGNTSDARLSHAAAGFLKQLARPTENEETLRAAGTVKAVFRQLS